MEIVLVIMGSIIVTYFLMRSRKTNNSPERFWVVLPLEDPSTIRRFGSLNDATEYAKKKAIERSDIVYIQDHGIYTIRNTNNLNQAIRYMEQMKMRVTGYTVYPSGEMKKYDEPGYWR